MTARVAGQRLGKYELLELLGNTTLAATYAARDTESGADVVVKVLSSYFREEPERVRPYVQVMDQLRTIRHPAILAVLDVGNDREHTWVAFERATAPSLAAIREPLQLGQALTLLADVAAAMDLAHAQGILHGDLKPTNVFVDAQGHAKLGDFGMGVLADAVHPLMRSTLNTPHPCYTAPERAHRLSDRPATDVYALGVLAYQLLTGHFPIFAMGASAVLAKQITESPVSASSRNPALPPAVDELLDRSLSRRPEVRPASAGELASRLRGAFAGADLSKRLPPQAHEEEGAERSMVRGSIVLGGGRAGADQSSAPAVAPGEQGKGGTKLCPACGAENREDAVFCLTCWARIERRRGATLDEARYLRRRMIAAARQRRALTAVLVFVPLALLAFWVVWQVTGPTHFLGAPTSAVAAVSAPGEWAMSRGGPARAGVAEGAATIQGRVVWTFPTSPLEQLAAAPAIVDGKVFLATGDKRILALDAATGAPLWQAATTGPVDSSPAVADGVMYVGLRDKRLLALDAASGALMWEFAVGNPISSSPTVANGVVYVTAGDGKLYALDAKTGKKQFSWDYGGYLLSSPAVIGDAVISNNQTGVIHVLDAFSGRHRQSYDLTAGINGSVAVVGDRLYIGSTNGRVLAWRWTGLEYPFERGWLRWHQYMVRWKMLSGPMPLQEGFLWGKAFRGYSFMTSPAATEDTVYLVNGDGIVLALAAATGETRWERRLGQPVRSSPVLAGDTLYVATLRGPVVAIDAATGAVKREMAIGTGAVADLVVAGGTLYVASTNGTLYAVR
jgi:outer membrane protein assembly factor BamB